MQAYLVDKYPLQVFALQVRVSLLGCFQTDKDATYVQDLDHESNSAYGADNYTEEYYHPEWSPDGWTHIIKGHACYDPTKVRQACSYFADISSYTQAVSSQVHRDHLHHAQ